MKVKSLGWTPYTYIMLYVNYTLIELEKSGIVRGYIQWTSMNFLDSIEAILGRILNAKKLGCFLFTKVIKYRGIQEDFHFKRQGS